jgi:AraC-like DNA-binding protein
MLRGSRRGRVQTSFLRILPRRLSVSWSSAQPDWSTAQSALWWRAGKPAGFRRRDAEGGTEVADWSTETVDVAERFSFWREVVCQTVLNVATEAPRERFQAQISGRSFGSLRFAAFHSTSHEIVRSAQHTARFPEDNYLISLQRRGQSRISQDGEAFSLDPGEVAIVDGQRPFRIGFPAAVSRVIAVIPRETLDMRMPWLRRSRAARKITGSSPYADLARRHLLQLASDERGLGESEANLLTDNLCNLLALASARDIPLGALQPDLQLEALLAFCRRHLSEADLSPQLVAARFGISVRTLHLRFERVGRTFGRWLLDSRLEACRRALRDPRQRACAISEIAYRCGFNDLSHFNKAFRAQFGMTPREARNLPQL